MSAISLAITQFFSAFTVLFAAFESGCKTVHNLATVAEESSGQYKDQARVDRVAKLRKLNADNGTSISSEEKPLAITE